MDSHLVERGSHNPTHLNSRPSNRQISSRSRPERLRPNSNLAEWICLSFLTDHDRDRGLSRVSRAAAVLAVALVVHTSLLGGSLAVPSAQVVLGGGRTSAAGTVRTATAAVAAVGRQRVADRRRRVGVARVRGSRGRYLRCLHWGLVRCLGRRHRVRELVRVGHLVGVLDRLSAAVSQKLESCEMKLANGAVPSIAASQLGGGTQSRSRRFDENGHSQVTADSNDSAFIHLLLKMQ